MADISTYTNQILNASKGEVVRDSIINAAKSMDSTGTNANTLDGHSVDDFVTYKDLQNAMSDIGKQLDKVNGNSVDGGVNYKINETLNAKYEIANAIINKGVIVGTSDPFSSYPEKVAEITGVNNPGTLVATAEGTYYAEGDGYDAYTEVNVDVESTLIDFEITEDGSYSAESEGASGFRSVKVNVAGQESGPFVVTFFSENGQTVLYTDTDVKKGSDAIYQGTTPEKENYIFSGWDPQPYNVRSDLSCYPKFTNPESQMAGLITDSWDDIIAHPENYAVGSYKTLELDGHDNILSPNDLTNYISMYPSSCIMEKIYDGEGDTPSTWMCQTLPVFKTTSGTEYVNYYPSNLEVPDPYSIYGWNDSEHIKTIRTWANREFLNKMIPRNLRSAIKQVKKYSFVLDGGGIQYIRNNPTLDKIWIPSLGEMYIDGVDITTNIQNNFDEREEEGVSYNNFYSTALLRKKKIQGSNSYGAYLLRSVGVGSSYNVRNEFNNVRTITASGSVMNYRSTGTYLCFGFCL